MTESRAASLAALESERRFRLLVQGVTDYAIYMLDPQGHVTNWNTGEPYEFRAVVKHPVLTMYGEARRSTL